MTLKEKILSRIIRTESGCWNWQGAKNSAGYGKVYWHDYNGKPSTPLTHRVMYELMVSPIPDGSLILHKCDNPSCCNPEHLFIGLQKDNVKDMYKKRRHAHGESLSIKIKAGWTSEKRAKRANQTSNRMRSLHEKSAELAGVPIDWKQCPTCNRWLPRTEFNKNKARHDGLSSHCKPCRHSYELNRLRAKTGRKTRSITRSDKKYFLEKS